MELAQPTLFDPDAVDLDTLTARCWHCQAATPHQQIDATLVRCTICHAAGIRPTTTMNNRHR